MKHTVIKEDEKENYFIVKNENGKEITITKAILEDVVGSDWPVKNVDVCSKNHEVYYNTTYDKIYFPLPLEVFMENYYECDKREDYESTN